MNKMTKRNKFLLMFLILCLHYSLCSFNQVSANPILRCHSNKECQSLFESTARKFLGAHYGYGSTSGRSFDCSGLVLAMVNSLLGKASLPRTSQEMYNSLAQKVSLDQAKRGDLIFFNTGKGVSHVGMYWGQDAKHNHIMYHSSSSKGVELRPLNGDKYWMSRLVAIKRFSPLQQALSSVDNVIPKKADNKETKKVNPSKTKEKNTEVKNIELAKYIEEEPIPYEYDMYQTASYQASQDEEIEYGEDYPNYEEEDYIEEKEYYDEYEVANEY